MRILRAPTARRLAVGVALWMLVPGAPSVALAQSGRLELGGAIEWLGPANLGERTATLERNPVEGATPFPLFTTNGDQNPAVGLNVTLGWRLTNRVTIQGGFLVSWPGIELTTTEDVEHEGEAISEGRLTEYLVDGGVLVDLATGNSAKWRPFISGGAGYLRQVHDEGAAIESGRAFYGGGGVKYRLRATPARRLKGVELRLQGRLLVRDAGFSLDDSPRASLNVGGGLVAVF